MQIDWWDREAWYIQDHATGTVRGFVDANGEMVRQQRFDAFGNLRSEDVFAIAGSQQLFEGFNQRLGHQGLFAERVDADTLALPLVVGGEVWYQNRSRWYVPELGRFLTSDPNETGVPTMQSLSMLGRVPTGPPSGSFGWEGHYGDGWDTWTAYGANPVMGTDPTGLFLLGFLGGASAQMEMAGSYSDEVLDAGAGATGFVNSYIRDAGYAQLDMVDMILDPSTPAGAFAGLNAAGMNFQTAGSVVLANVAGGRALSWATSVASGYQRHHIIPAFLMGRRSALNRLDLPRAKHSTLHRLIEEEFGRGPNPLKSPNTRGADGWKRRFESGRVTHDEMRRAYAALLRAGRRFDSTPGNSAYKVATQIRNVMDDDGAVNLAKRGLGLLRRR